MNNIHIINDKIYKKNIIKINFERKANRDEVTRLNMLAHILLNSSKKYETPRKLLRETKELYDLGMSSYATNYGKITVLTFRFTFLRDEYSEKGNSLRSIDFIKELLFNPNAQNGKFNLKVFKQARDEVIDEIKAEAENKGAYSRRRMLEEMDKESPASINMSGDLKELKKITAKNLYELYLDVIKNSVIDVFSFGNTKESYFAFLKRKNQKRSSVTYESKERETKTVIEKDDINQSKLVLGFNLNGLKKEEEMYHLQVYLYLLGQGPNSKLFTEVREKESLCYNISASAKVVYSLMIITAGIDASKFKKTVSLIEEQVQKMKKGDFKKRDVDSAKLVIKSSYQELLEDPYSILRTYESNIYLGYDLVKKRLKKIDEVKMEDIVEVAKKVKLNTIYLLEGKKK